MLDSIEVVGSAPDGETAWRELQRLKPDLLVTDIEMPGLTGLDLALRVRDAGLSTRVVIITTFARAGYLRRALDAGVRGYLLKDAPSGQLAAALRQVNAGGRVIDPHEQARVVLQRIVEPATQIRRRARLGHAVLDQLDLVVQGVAIEHLEMPVHRDSRQARHAKQQQGRHQAVEQRQPRGQRQTLDHGAGSGTSST